MAPKMERAALGIEGGPSGFVSGQGRLEDSKACGGDQSKRPIAVALLAMNSHETVGVALDCHRGSDQVDVRVCVDLTATSGLLTCTGKSVSLAVAKFPELLAALTAAEAKARELGLFGENGE